MAERMVQWFVRVSHVDAVIQQRACQVLAGRAVALHGEGFIVRLVPHVAPAAIALPRLNVDGVVSEYGERGHAVFAKILVLIVAPDQHAVGLERVEFAADLAELVDHFLAMLIGVALTAIIAPLLAHRRVPVFHGPQVRGQGGIVEALLRAPAHVRLRRKVGEVSDAETENLTHARFSSRPILTVSWSAVQNPRSPALA